MAIPSSFYPPLAPYAADASKARRLIPEPPSPTRTDFHRDRDRILHSAAFRRLKGKTQVFMSDTNDHFRTRLTHTLEVSQIARSLSRALGFDEDLAETIALAHDLGHPPFGHAGEDALNALVPFNHNEQTLKVVTKLERRYATFDGLNLTFNVIEGLIKHNGAILNPTAYILALNNSYGFDLSIEAGGEAQAAAIADDIAYAAHDLDDGLRSGLLTREHLSEASFTREIANEVNNLYPNLETQRFIYEVSRRVITRLVEDVIGFAKEKTLTFSPEMALKVKELKAMMFKNLYRHPVIMKDRAIGEKVITRLFEIYANDKSIVSPVDYIAGMTDAFALEIYKQFN
jgi:dGTPase